MLVFVGLNNFLLPNSGLLTLVVHKAENCLFLLVLLERLIEGLESNDSSSKLSFCLGMLYIIVLYPEAADEVFQDLF